MKFSRILIANRGEIAVRVMRSIREMGISTVAVYSDADRDALHVRYADEAICLGPSPGNQSYLRIDKVIEAAVKTGAQAIHPGYGFLSENPAFARAVRESGLVLIGPSPEAMEMMGSKLAAKAAAKKYDIPLVPGTDYPISDVNEARKIAREVGFPILIKASAGGGGKGMRIVEAESQFDEMLERAVSEATSAFGDGSVFIERYVGSPRHIEIQVLGDQHGTIVHLFERECSVQRRHQKVVEEAPSSVLTPDKREAMGRCAVMIAKACNYVGAGTVEFLLDENLNFYFLEMNTRLQVEHPVTEMITGIDLVKEQVRIAQGEPLSFSQDELSINGHAIESRVYAEDPSNDFLPDIGVLRRYVKPSGPGVRVDDGYEEGMSIPIFYDPMIAKLVTWGKDRAEAIDRQVRAIDDYTIVGCQTTLPFCRFVMNHESFRSGNFDTHFVKHHFKPGCLVRPLEPEEEKAAVILSSFLQKSDVVAVSVNPEKQVMPSLWKINRR